ncbi:MAG: site-specific DNA-methyltransferase [Alloprevotella sp.]|nr:site-specific DNA-methyltransferase [Alloprevotella sp.]
MENPKRLSLQSADGVQLNLDALYQIAPSCFTEAADSPNGGVKRVVNFDILRQLLGDDAVEDATEAYEFNWVGKQAARAEVLRPINKTLRPVKEDSVDWDTTQNLYIEGDNLEVLKLLQKSYLGKVKMIYIDPPYNTGNDFVYHDDRGRSQEKEDLAAGNIDELGNRYRKNTDSNGRYHSDWCSMIYTRLIVARSLLTEDGVIFISIDDNEVENLKKISNEVFGENNFVATFPWRKRTAKSDVPFGVSQDFEWIVVYAKSNIFCASVEGKERKYYITNDFPNKPWRIHDMSTQRTALERPNSNFTMINPKNGKEYPVNPQAVWRVTKDGFPQYLKENRIVFPDDYDFLNISRPVLRYWKEDDEKKAGDAFGRIAVTTKMEGDIGMSQDGTKEISSLFDCKVFSYPKPSSLIKFFLKIINDNNSIILDFFSGSATTAHAVMQLNAEDGGNRKFILVQLPEETPDDSEAHKAGYKNICEIGKERIRRAGKKIKEESPLTTQDLDTGFRVFRVDESNFEDVERTPKLYNQDQLELFLNNIKSDRTDLDLLFGCMLNWGVQLSLPMTTEEVDGKMIYTVNEGDLVACFDDKVTDNVVRAMAEKQPLRVIFRDSCFERDADKINIYETFKQLMDWSDQEVVKNIRVI